MMHCWQSESTDGPEERWSCLVWRDVRDAKDVRDVRDVMSPAPGGLIKLVWSGCSGHLTHNCWT